MNDMSPVSIDLLIKTERQLHKEAKKERKRHKKQVDMPLSLQRMEMKVYIIRTIIWRKALEESRSRLRNHDTNLQEA